MDIQIISLAAVKEIIRRKPIWGSHGQPMMYVISRCPDRERKVGHLYGTMRWDASHGTLNFRERCRRAA